MSAFDDYQIKRSADPTMVSFARIGIAIPDQVVFKEAALTYVRADFSRVGDGYPSVTWVWDILSKARLYTLVSILDGNESADVRIRTDVRNGESGNPESSFKIFDAIMWKPVLSGQEGISVARSDIAFQTVSINFRKLIEV